MQLKEEDWNVRATAFFAKVSSEYARVSDTDLTEMYVLYNDRVSPHRSKTGCGACNGETWKRLKRFYDERGK